MNPKSQGNNARGRGHRAAVKVKVKPKVNHRAKAVLRVRRDKDQAKAIVVPITEASGEDQAAGLVGIAIVVEIVEIADVRAGDRSTAPLLILSLKN
jgi:hypothetical protein